MAGVSAPTTVGMGVPAARSGLVGGLHCRRVDPDRYRVWVHEGPEATAPITPGATVAVTSWAVHSLPSRHLEAVLAHELAHHLAVPRALSLLLYWLALPARLMGRGVIFCLRHRVLSILAKIVMGFLLLGVLGVVLPRLLALCGVHVVAVPRTVRLTMGGPHTGETGRSSRGGSRIRRVPGGGLYRPGGSTGAELAKRASTRSEGRSAARLGPAASAGASTQVDPSALAMTVYLTSVRAAVRGWQAGEGSP